MDGRHKKDLGGGVGGKQRHDAGKKASTRRAFIKEAATKALYVTPAVLTLTASEAKGGSGADWDSTCREDGSPCLVDAECCTGLMCIGGSMFCMG